MKIAAIIPAFNEATKVGKVVTLTLKYVDEVFVVDDGSSDSTPQVARKAGATVIAHDQNCGAGAAPMTGFVAARAKGYQAVVTLDADGQMNPEDIPALLEPIKNEEADIVYGNRFGQKNRIPLIRRIFNSAGNLLTYLATGLWVPDSQSGFKAFGPKALKEVDLKMNGFEYCSEIVRETSINHWRAVHIPVKVIYSEYTLAKGQSFARGIQTALKILLRSLMR